MNDEALMFVDSAWNGTVSKLEFDAIMAGVFHTHALKSTSAPRRLQGRALTLC